LRVNFCQKILSHSANFFSNLLTRSDQRVLGSLTSKYCRQLLIMSMLVVLNNFIRKRTLTKFTDERSDFSNGQAFKPYKRTGIHLGDRSFPVAASRAWNSLSAAVRDTPSLLCFRRRLKTSLFQSSFDC